VRDFMVPVDQHASETLEDFEEDAGWLTPDDSVEAALRAFDRTGHNRLPVVESEDTSKLTGWAEHLDALNAFNAALIEASEEEHK
jgi:CIC family chloride channel protein